MESGEGALLILLVVVFTEAATGAADEPVAQVIYEWKDAGESFRDIVL